jgi:hypothetical protein
VQEADHLQEIEKTDEEGWKTAGEFGENGEKCDFTSSAIISILFFLFALFTERRKSASVIRKRRSSCRSLSVRVEGPTWPRVWIITAIGRLALLHLWADRL